MAPSKCKKLGKPLCCESTGSGDDEAAEIQRFTFDKNAAFTNAHERFLYDFNIFSTNLYYLTCDFRKRRTLKLVSDKKYTKRGQKAERNGKPVKGVHGVWAFGALPYSDYRQHVTFDPFHVEHNIVSNQLQNMKGKRVKKDSKISRFCKSIHVHPSLYSDVVSDDREGRPPWEIPVEYQERIEHAVNCVLVPVGHGANFSIEDIFSASGHLRGTAAIMLFTTLMELMLSVGHKMSVAYKALNLIISKDLSDLNATEFRIDNGEIGELSERLFETSSIHEGLMPESEALFCWHQWNHHPHSISELGPLECFTTLSGERAIPALKKGVPKGGSDYEKIVIKRFTAFEEDRLEGAYNFDHTTLQPGNVANGILRLQKEMHDSRFVSVENGQMLYTYQRIHLRNPLTSRLTFTEFELSQLFQNLCSFIECVRFSGDDAAAIRGSVLYRVHRSYTTYNEYCKTNGLVHWSSCVRWLNALIRGFIGGEVLPGLGEYREYWYEDLDVRQAENIVDSVYRGILFRSDLVAIAAFLARNGEGFKCFRNADVMGTKFYSRGMHAREQETPVGGEATNLESNLRLTWHLKRDYSSWMKFRPVAVQILAFKVRRVRVQ